MPASHTRHLTSFLRAVTLCFSRLGLTLFLSSLLLSCGLLVAGGGLHAASKLPDRFTRTEPVRLLANTGMWTPTAGPAAQRIRSLAANNPFIFAGSFGSGVFRSDNNGASWQQVNAGLTATDVRALLVSGSRLFAGTNTGGVFVTTNNGDSWSSSGSGLPSPTVTSLAANGIHLFAGTGHGVALSTNNGASWTQVINGTGDVAVLSLAVNNGAVYAGTANNGIFKSLDNGASWTAVSSGLPSQTPIRSLTAASNGHLYAGPGTQGIYRSTNNGATWAAVNTGIPAGAEVSALIATSAGVFAGIDGAGVFLSTDNGTNWTAVNAGLTEYLVYSFAVNGNYLFAGTEHNGVFTLQFCAPIITTQPTNQTVCIGSPASFSVAAAGPGLSYQWRKNGVNLMNSGNIAGATSPTLSINQAGPGDMTNYDVSITGACGTTLSSAATLSVSNPPVITQQPTDAAACPGQPVTFSVTATGTNLSYQWRKGGLAIPNATASTLLIAAASANDTYDVVITSGACSLTSTAATLTVGGPLILTQPSNQLAFENESASFTATASGSPTPTIQWQVSTDHGQSFNNISGALNAVLSLSPVTLTQEGNLYRAVFSNACGTATSATARLTVERRGRWTRTAGPGGGDVRALIPKGTMLFAAAIRGGIFRSTDNGANWKDVSNGLKTLDILSLATNGTDLFAGTGNSGPGGTNGIYHSIDDGENWALLPGSPNILTALAASGTTIYAGTGNGQGIWRSMDKGTTWQELDTGLPRPNGSLYPNINSFVFTTDAKVIASGDNPDTQGGVYRLKDDRSGWDDVTPFGVSGRGNYKLAVNGPILYASRAASGSVGEIYRSTDNGTNWTWLNPTVRLPGITALAVSGSTILAGTNGEGWPFSQIPGGIFRSTDGGTTWQQINTGLPQTVEDPTKSYLYITGLVFQGGKALAATVDGIYCSSDNGLNWQRSSSGLAGTTASARAVNGNNLFAWRSGTGENTKAYGTGVHLSLNGGASWTDTVTGLDDPRVLSFAASGGYLFAGTEAAGVFRSGDNGRTWVEVNTNEFKRPPSYTEYIPISYLAASGGKVIAALHPNFDAGFYISEDNGEHWNLINALPLQTQSVVADGAVFYASSDSGFHRYRLLEENPQWRSITSPAGSVKALVSLGTTLYAGTTEGLHRSTNDGASWVRVNSGILQPGSLSGADVLWGNISSLAVKDSMLFVGGNGVYRSPNGETGWMDITCGLREFHRNVSSLTIIGDHIFAGTENGGVYVNRTDVQPLCAPTIAAQAGVTRQQGSPASSSQIATVADAETSPGSLLVTVASENPSNGVTVSNIANNNGAITADIVAACNAASTNFTLRVNDGTLTGTAILNVTVTANAAPTLTYANPQTVAFGGTLNVTPTTASDNGTVSYQVLDGHGLTTAPTVNASGVVTITNAQPAGAHTITIRTTDNCGAMTEAQFTLNVAANCSTSLTVNNLGDTADVLPGNGLCADANGACSLRAAVMEANALTTCAPLTINFNVTGTINLATALPMLNHPNLMINGPGAQQLTVQRSTLGGTPGFRIFTFYGVVRLSGLTVVNGLASNGGGIYNSGSLTLDGVVVNGNTSTSGGGAGIDNEPCATLSINNSTITSNVGAIYGGGVLNQGTLVLRNSLLANNAAGVTGGGLDNRGTATLLNVTISGNQANGSGGGGVFNNTDLTLINCTITNNSTTNANPGGGGIKYVPATPLDSLLETTSAGCTMPYGSGPVKLQNTLVAGNNSGANGAHDISGLIISQGHNLIGKTDGSSGYGGTDLTGTNAAPLNARLTPLGNYGGATPTHALLCGSPALDAGSNVLAVDPSNGNALLASDQRGLPRVQDSNGDLTNAVDIGAFEVQKYSVTTAADSGAGSLRQAILENNALGGGLIAFNLGSAGVQTIAPNTQLPELTKPVSIDGYTQPGASRNTLAVGNNAALLIELNGTNAGGGANGLALNTGYACIRGLVINRFAGAGVLHNGAVASHNWINGNFIGTNASGTATLPNGYGVWIFMGSHNVIGTDNDGLNDPAERNLLSGNTLGNGVGVAFQAGATGNLIAGNYIGTSAAGTMALPNTYGVFGIEGAHGNMIGGATAAARNVISGNQGVGIRLDTVNNTIIQGNYIGMAANGMAALSNQVGPHGPLTPGDGITLQKCSGTIVGGTTAGAGNIIAFNAASGISLLDNSLTNRIVGNASFANGGLALDIGGNGVTGNDPGDGDAAQNNGQNFPVLNVATSTAISGMLDSQPAHSAYPVRLEFFANAACDVSGFGEGETYLGFLTLAAPGSFTFNYSPVAGRPFITATATDNHGNTSEFSPCLIIANTGNGTNVSPPLPPGSPQITFANVNMPGYTNATPIPAPDAGNLPAGFTLAGLNVAYQITTTAAFSGPIVLTFEVPGNVTPAQFSTLRVLHGENGFLVDRTILAPNSPAPNFATKKISALVTSLSPFVLAARGTAPAINLTANPAAPAFGQSVTLTSTVSNNAAPLTSGSVTFKENATTLAGPLALNANGQASFSTASLSPGPHTIKVEYNGADSLFLPAQGSLTFTVACPLLTLAPTTLPNGQIGTAYNQPLSVAPSGSYSFALSSGVLPPGLSLNAITGVISGTPTAAGNYSLAVKVIGYGGQCSLTHAYNLLITGTCATLTISPATLPSGTLGTAYQQQFTVTGGSAPYTFNVASGALPAGLHLEPSTGLLSGTATTSGSFAFTVRTTAASGCTGQRTYVLTINCPVVALNPVTLPAARRNVMYTQTLTAHPTAIYSFNVLTGSLPPGFTLNSTTGLLSGTTTVTGNYSFTIRARTVSGCQGTRAYTLSIGSSPLLAARDFDGDGRSELIAWQNNRLTGELEWFISYSADGSSHRVSWGVAGDQPVVADYDGDSRADLAVYRATEGRWLLKLSSKDKTEDRIFGAPGAVPVPADYDGDGITDLAVWQNGTWTIAQSTTGLTQTLTCGTTGSLPVPADYDGDGRTDVAVYESAVGQWRIYQSSTGVEIIRWFGGTMEVPCPGDYDGDGITDLAVWRSPERRWYVEHSATQTQAIHAWPAGDAGSLARLLPGDYNGDGQLDFALWLQPLQSWQIWEISKNITRTHPLGVLRDRPTHQ